MLEKRVGGKVLSAVRHRSVVLILGGLVAGWTIFGFVSDQRPQDLLGWALYGSIVLALIAELVALRRDRRRREQMAELEAALELLRAELRATEVAHGHHVGPKGLELRHEVSRDMPETQEAVPSALAGSETLAALWRRGRRTGRDEVSCAIEGLRTSGGKALTDLRAAEEDARPHDAATCAHGLAGVAAVLGCRELESMCRSYADEPGIRAEDLDRELASAVEHLRTLWPEMGADERPEKMA